MNMNPELKNLAETLKKSGLAASESEAVRMARGIDDTDKKVRVYFKQKSGEIEQELDKRSCSSQENEDVKETINISSSQEPEVSNTSQVLQNAEPSLPEQKARDSPSEINLIRGDKTDEESIMQEDNHIYSNSRNKEDEIQTEPDIGLDSQRSIVSNFEDEAKEEVTREIKETEPQKPASEMVESSVDLSTMFNFSKK